MNQLLKLIKTRELLDDNSIIPYWKQMEILNDLDSKDSDKCIREHYTQFLKEGVINQEKYNSLMQMYGIKS